MTSTFKFFSFAMFLKFLFRGKHNADKEIKYISPSELKKGMIVKLPISWFRHPFLTSRVKIKNNEQIEKIRDLNLPYVIQIVKEEDKVSDGECEQWENECTENNIRKDDAEGIQEKRLHNEEKEISLVTEDPKVPAKLHHIRIQQCQKAYDKTLVEVKRLIGGVLAFSDDAVKESGEVMKKMVELLLQNPFAMMFLVNAKKKTEEIFHHSLNTSILGLLLGRAEGLSAEDLFLLGMGLLFHDIGKIRIPKSIIYKETPLTKAERDFLRQHPRYGVEIVSKIKTFPISAAKIVYQHHELLDGSGYPKGLKGKQINILTRIATIVNIYDNYCNRRKIEESLTPHAALAHMYRKLTKKLDRKILERFIRLMGIYPPGTLVQLNDGSYGIVVGKNPASPHKPVVLLYDPSVPSSKAPVISLQEEKNLSIVKSLKPSNLPEEVFYYLNPPLRIAYMIDSFEKL